MKPGTTTTNIRPMNIIDAVMGAGKTTYAINMMNGADHKETRFIYITPYLSEVSRIIEACPARRFVQPDTDGWNKTKSEALHDLIGQGRNIASTHSLFKMIDEDTAELIRIQGYVLVMDEVASVLEALKARPREVQDLIDADVIRLAGPVLEGANILKTEPGDREWLTKYSQYRDMAAAGRLVVVDDTALMWLLPPSLLEVFDEVWLMTYMFDGQPMKAYFDMFDIPCKHWTLDSDNRLCAYSFERANLPALLAPELINIADRGRINKIGDTWTAFSVTWYKRDTKAKTAVLQKNLMNFFRHAPGGVEYHLWTTFDDVKDKMAGKGYGGAFLACNARATNEYQHKRNLAYCCNRFLNPYIVSFFRQGGVKIDEDTYALSEMLQWIWRSRIRKGESIYLYVPSKRMRDLLTNWLDMVEPTAATPVEVADAA